MSGTRRAIIQAQPAPLGIFLRSTASFADPTNPANTLIAPSSSVRYILGTAADEQLVGGDLPTFIFAGGGDDVITAGTGLLRAFGGEGNDRFLAVTGDGGAIYDGQAGINTYDMSGTLAGATVSLVTGLATSAQTGADRLISIQNIVGSLGDDMIVGDEMDNVLTGAGGNDTIDGGGGNDTFVARGSDGDDTYTGVRASIPTT